MNRMSEVTTKCGRKGFIVAENSDAAAKSFGDVTGTRISLLFRMPNPGVGSIPGVYMAVNKND